MTIIPETATLSGRIQKRLLIFWVKFRDWGANGRAFWHFMLWVIINFLVALVLVYLFCLEFTKSLSTMLELVGIGYVFKQINGKRNSFGKGAFFGSGISWLREFPTIFSKPRVISAAANVTLGALKMTGQARVSRVSASSSVFDRLDVVEDNLILTQQEIDQLRSELNKSKTDVKNSLQLEAVSRADEDAKIFALLKNLSVADSEFEYLGLVFVAVGVVVSNAPAITPLIFTTCIPN